jgi:hypothetical protein
MSTFDIFSIGVSIQLKGQKKGSKHLPKMLFSMSWMSIMKKAIADSRAVKKTKL